MKKFLAISAALMCSIAAFSQSKGGLSPADIAQISKGYEGNAYDKAVRNALNQAQIGTLAINAENAAMIDTHFSDRVRTKGITDQKSSGRCWLFTGLNVLRADFIDREGLDAFEFSQNYCFFWDQLEKSNLFLQAVIDTRDKPMDDREVDWLFSNPISDGGTFTGVANLVSKYGLVPSEAMPESFAANSTSQMASHLKTLLRQQGLELRDVKIKAKGAGEREAFLQARKIEMLKDVYHVLAIFLGVPPTQFEWHGKTWTPVEFYKQNFTCDLENDFVMLMNDPCREYGKTYEIQYDRHLYDGQNWLYLNLPIEDIKACAIASIKDNTAMYFSCDVAKFLDRTKGVADLANFDYESILGVKFTMDKRQRVMTHASGSSHAMTLIAVDIKDGQSVKWMVENSWGAASGYKGNIIMTDEWFNEYMFRLVVNKKYVPAELLKKLEQKPELLPAWDPMFSQED